MVGIIARNLPSSNNYPEEGSIGELTSTLYNTVNPSRLTSLSDRTPSTAFPLRAYLWPFWILNIQNIPKTLLLSEG